MDSSMVLVGIIYLLTFGVFGLVFLAWKYRYYYLPDRMRIRVLGENNREKVRVIKVATSDKHFDLEIFGSRQRFNIRRDRIFETGGERMPTLEYNSGDAEPKRRDGENSIVDSVRYREVAVSGVIRDLLNAFKKRVIDANTALIIMICVVLIASLAVGVFVHVKFEELQTNGVPVRNQTTSQQITR